MNTGKVDVLLGLQWGDEGKGKVVDVLTPKYDVIARFQGGPNAGHTLEFEGQKYVLRSIPSGIFQGGKVNIIGNGVVLAPDLFMQEAKDLEKSGHDLKSRLHISKRTLQEYRHAAFLPYFIIGGKVLYRESDIQALLESNYRNRQNEL